MLSADQQAQAESLHNAVGWVYPSTENVAFWDQFFNQSVPELTPQEQASGISLGPYGPGQQQAAYEREQASLSQPSTPQVLPPAPGGFAPPPAPGGLPQGGNPVYVSNLISALRAATPAGPGNPGVSMLPNPAPAPATAFPGLPAPAATGLINDPPVLKMTPVQPGRATAATTTPTTLRGLIEQAYDASVGSEQTANGGGSPVGQGINNSLTSLGLGLMAYGDAGKGLAPGSLAAGLLGSALAGQQVDAMGRAADTLSGIQNAGLPGVVAVSDAHGNVYGYSSPGAVAAADAAAFGPDATAVGGSTLGTDALGPSW
jgi:hypothetical protein